MKSRILLIALLAVLCSLSVIAQSQAEVITKTAKFHEKPSIKSKVIFTAKHGAKFKVESETHKNGWYYVSTLKGNVKGWMYGNSIKIGPTNGEANAEDDVYTAMAKMSLAGEGWDPIAKAERKNYQINYFFNPSKISKADNLVNFWIKSIPSDKSFYWIDQFENILHLPMPSSLEPADYDYDLSYFQCDCKARLLRHVKDISYWKSGKIDDNPSNELDLSPVIPDSIGESFLRSACKVKQ